MFTHGGLRSIAPTARHHVASPSSSCWRGNIRLLSMAHSSSTRMRRRRCISHAAHADASPQWTLDQIAGLAFGGLLVACYFAAGIVDRMVAREQRRELGLCEECGGVYDPAVCQQHGCPSKTQPRA